MVTPALKQRLTKIYLFTSPVRPPTLVRVNVNCSSHDIFAPVFLILQEQKQGEQLDAAAKFDDLLMQASKDGKQSLIIDFLK